MKSPRRIHSFMCSLSFLHFLVQGGRVPCAGSPLFLFTRAPGGAGPDPHFPRSPRPVQQRAVRRASSSRCGFVGGAADGGIRAAWRDRSRRSRRARAPLLKLLKLLKLRKAPPRRAACLHMLRSFARCRNGWTVVLKGGPWCWPPVTSTLPSAGGVDRRPVGPAAVRNGARRATPFID